MQEPRSPRRHTSLLWLALALLQGGCHSTEAAGPTPVSPREVTPDMVTGVAAAALGAGGLFIMPLPASVLGQIPLDTAREQTLQFAKYVTNNLLLRGVVESGRGGYWTDPHRLVLCSHDVHFIRPQIAHPDIDSLPDQGRELLLRKFGPQWLLALCGEKGEPQMTVQVALEGNAVRFLGGLPIEPDPFLLSAFSPHGVPLDWPDALPVSAERAVRFAYDQLGARITEIPELFVRGDSDAGAAYDLQPGAARNCNRWRIALDRDVAVQRAVGAAVRMTNVVYVASYSCRGTDVAPLLQLPVEAHPTEVSVRYVDYGVSPPRTYSVRVAVASPIKFDVVHPASQ